MEWIIDEIGQRIDIALSHKSGLSRNQCQKLIEKGAAQVNGSSVKKRLTLTLGDTLSLIMPEPPKLTPTPLPLDIVFEDDHIIVINKAAGITTHPAPTSSDPTLVHALLHHCTTLPDTGDPLRPGIVHRLDKGTTGLLIAAKSKQAYENLVAAFASRAIEKEYLAISVGNPGKTTLETKIGRNPNKRQEMTVLKNSGKLAITHIEPISWNEELSYLKILLETGRTHQIRVHLRHLKAPVLGDPVYGSEKVNNKKGIKTPLLHAHKLTLKHPITDEPLEFTAPLPDTFTPFIPHYNA
jgi:23S rRNA pseudouridine1911/1915/1917 synthase